MALRPSEGPWGYAFDAIDAVEEANCSKGCVHGARTRAALAEWGPGGQCDVLAQVAIGDEVVDELTLGDGGRVTCSRYEMLPPSPPRERKPKPAPAGQLTIGES